MKIIYHSYYPSYAAAVAAAVHTMFIPELYTTKREAFLEIPYFGAKFSCCFGMLFYMGLDEYGNEVYILGRKNASLIVKNALDSLNRILNLNEDVYYVDISCFDRFWPINTIINKWTDYIYYLYIRKRFKEVVKVVSTIKNHIALTL